MNIYSAEHIRDKIERNPKMTRAVFYEGHLSKKQFDEDEAVIFECIDTDSNTQLLKEFDKWAEKYHGRFTVQLRDGKAKNLSNFQQLFCEFTPKSLPENKEKTFTPAEPINGSRIEEIEKRVEQRLMERFEAEKAKEAEENKRKQLEDELNQFKTNGGKLAYAIEQLITRITMSNNAFNGWPGQPGVNRRKNENKDQQPQNGQPQNQTQEIDLDQLIDWLIDDVCGGEQQFANLCLKLQNDPQTQNLIKTYANG